MKELKDDEMVYVLMMDLVFLYLFDYVVQFQIFLLIVDCIY